MFLANYGDTLTDAPLDRIVEEARRGDRVATLLGVRPPYSFHVVRLDDDQKVLEIAETSEADLRINGGCYVLKPGIFDHLASGQDLVDEPFRQLADEGQLLAIPYDGFSVSLDTLKELQTLLELEATDHAPWAVWRTGDGAPP